MARRHVILKFLAADREITNAWSGKRRWRSRGQGILGSSKPDAFFFVIAPRKICIHAVVLVVSGSHLHASIPKVQLPGLLHRQLIASVDGPRCRGQQWRGGKRRVLLGSTPQCEHENPACSPPPGAPHSRRSWAVVPRSRMILPFHRSEPTSLQARAIRIRSFAGVLSSSWRRKLGCYSPSWGSGRSRRP